MSRKLKFVLWLKSTLVTLIVIILFCEVFIVINEARKLLNYDVAAVNYSYGALHLKYGKCRVQIGPSKDELCSYANFIVNNSAILVPPFNLICLAQKVVAFCGLR